MPVASESVASESVASESVASESVRKARSAALVPYLPVPLPEARHGHCVVALPDRLLCCGGFAPGAGAEAGRLAFELLPGAQAWHATGSMRRDREFFRVVTIHGVAYAVGDGVERFDASRDEWDEIVPPGALPRSHFAAAALGRQIFVLGGYPVERSAFLVVDVDQGAVTLAPAPPGFARGDHFHFLATLAGELHVVGGLDVGPFEPRREHWVRDAASGSWRAMAEPPAGLWSKFGDSAVLDDRWFLFGEFGGYRYSSDDGWQPCRNWDGLLAMPAVLAVGSELWAFGGLQPGGHRRSELRRYEVSADRWQLSSGPGERE